MQHRYRNYLFFIALFFMFSCGDDSSVKKDLCKDVTCGAEQTCKPETGQCACIDRDKTLNDAKECICKDEAFELNEDGNCVPIDPCKGVTCGVHQLCDASDGSCYCENSEQILDESQACVCKNEEQVINENNECVDKAVVLPLIQKVSDIQTDMQGYTEETKPRYTFYSNKAGSLHLSGRCKLENKPDVVVGNNTIVFDELGSGLYDNCELWISDEKNSESNHLKLKPFTLFHVAGVEQIRGRNDGKGVDYVIIGDGFQKDDLPLFREKANEFMEYVLNYDPILSKQKTAWNIHLVDLVSEESGADYTGDEELPELVNTGLDSYFNCSDIPRLLCVNQWKVNYIVGKKVPQFDKVLVIVNSNTYGGAGGNYATASINPAGKDIAIHELGHSFAGLGDEYSYGGSEPPLIEPVEANLTIDNNPETIKWKLWLDKEHIGIFEGGSYSEVGVYRPTENSLMKVLGQPLYEVNLEAWTLSLYRMVGHYFSFSPELIEDESITLPANTNHAFTVELSIGTDVQKLTWFVDGVEQVLPEDTSSFTYGEGMSGHHEIKVIITDKTGAIRSDPQQVSKGEILWHVTFE